MNIEEFIDGRLDAMLAHPEHWGDAEAFEMQVLLLLELRQFLRAPASPSQSLRMQTDLYSDFLRARYPEVGPRPLSAAGYEASSIAHCMEQFRTFSSGSSTPAPAEPPPAAPDGLGLDVDVSQDNTTMPRAQKEAA